METNSILFVGNLSSLANDIFLHSLFTAYGDVQKIELFGEGDERYAEVTMESSQTADVSIAALHHRYCSAPGMPLIVLYSKNSPIVSEYGHAVGKEYLSALNEDRSPTHIPLEQYNLNNCTFQSTEGEQLNSNTNRSSHGQAEVTCS